MFEALEDRLLLEVDADEEFSLSIIDDDVIAADAAAAAFCNLNSRKSSTNITVWAHPAYLPQRSRNLFAKKFSIENHKYSL